MPDGDRVRVVVSTYATSAEAEADLAVVIGRGISGELRSGVHHIELVIAAADAPAARGALLDREESGRSEMTLPMKLALVAAFLAVVAFAVLTVTLG